MKAMRTKGYAKSVIGSREMNQDSYLIADEAHLYAVADGVGGGLRGEVASRIAVDGLKAMGATPEGFAEVFRALQANVLREAMESIGEALMGTTLSAALVKGNQISVCHVGDSRLYHYSASQMRLLTEDQELFDETTQNTVLASYLGIPEEIHPLQIYEDTVTVAPGDRLLLCSDGLYKQMDDIRMVALIRTHLAEPEVLVRNLCDEASNSDYSDNVTVVYVEIEDDVAAPTPAPATKTKG